MAPRILVAGNCHAQYFGAALRALTDLDVKVLGRPFEGPVHFNAVLPDMIDTKSGLEWFKSSPEIPIMLLQTTPMTKEGLSERLTATGFRHHTVRFPFIRYAALDVRSIPEGPDGDRAVRRALRLDTIFNESSMLSAGLAPEGLQKVRQALSMEPSFYMNSHYTGAIYAEIFAFMENSELAYLMGSETFKRFIDGVRLDIGVSHLLGPMPHPRIMEAMDLKWSLNDLIKTRYNQTLHVPARLNNKGQSNNGVVDFSIFRLHYNQFNKSKNRRHLRMCLKLYKENRFFLNWTPYLADIFMDIGRPLCAAIILLHRMAWDNARGSSFSLVLTRLPALARFPSIRPLFEKYAQQYPDSQIPLANACLKQLG